MDKIIKVLSGNPGVGKTQQFIDQLDTDKRYVYVAPTRELAKEVMQRLDATGKQYTPIFTSQTNGVGSVIHLANKALDAKDAQLIIITHKCLASVKPEFLKGWHLFVDENLKVEQIESLTMLSSEFERTIAPFIEDCDENGNLIINSSLQEEAWEIHAKGLDDAKNKRMRNKPLLLVLDAMLSPTKSVTATPRTDKKGKPVVRIQVEGFTDFSRPFDYASSVTLMGANIDQSLVVKHAQKRGFRIEVDKKKVFKAGVPIIFPLIRDHEGAFVSKRMLMTMPDGSVASEWNSECFGQHVLNRALEQVGHQEAIFASHEWCKPVLPKNVERTPFDVRGLNKWQDWRISIHMLHGNPSPDELGPTKRIIEKMGLDQEEVNAALRWAREHDNVLQFANRTKVRDADFEGHTWHIVTSYTQARKLAFDLDGQCIIDVSLMIDPPEALPSEDQIKRSRERGDLASQAKTLRDQGASLRNVAKKLGLSLGKVQRLLS